MSSTFKPPEDHPGTNECWHGVAAGDESPLNNDKPSFAYPIEPAERAASYMAAKRKVSFGLGGRPHEIDATGPGSTTATWYWLVQIEPYTKYVQVWIPWRSDGSVNPVTGTATITSNTAAGAQIATTNDSISDHATTQAVGEAAIFWFPELQVGDGDNADAVEIELVLEIDMSDGKALIFSPTFEPLDWDGSLTTS